MNCPKCGNNIGDFEFCPYCGAATNQAAPQQPSAPQPPVHYPVVVQKTKKKLGCMATGFIVLVIFVTVIVVAVIISSIGNSGSGDGSNSSSAISSAEVPNSPEPGEEGSPIEISASDLWAAYSENKVNADNLYKNKWLSVSGTISDITQDMLTKAPCVNLDTGDQLGIYPVQCFFKDDGEGNADIAALKDDQEITIIGKCDGTPILQVQLTHCRLSE